MTDQCETCGQELGHSAPAGGTWIDEPAAPAQAPYAERSSGGRDRRWLAVLAGVAAAWLGVIGIARIAAPDEIAVAPVPSPTPQTAANPEPTTTLPENEGALSLNQVNMSESGESSEPSESGTDTAMQVDRLSRQLGRRSTNVVLAYRSRDGVVTVDLSDGTTEIVDVGPVTAVAGDDTVSLDDQLEVLAQLDGSHVILHAGSETFAIDQRTLGVTRLGHDGGLVTVDDQRDIVYWVPGPGRQGQASQAVALVDDERNWFRPPGGAQLVGVDGLGLLAVARARHGGTWIADGDEFVAMSTDRVLAANGAGVLEHVCPDAQPDGPCDFVLRDLTTDERWTLPTGFVDIGDRFLLSPDARRVLRHTPYGFSEVFDVRDRSVIWVEGSSLHTAAWSADSNFVVWIDPVESVLSVMFIDERDWVAVELDGSQGRRPIGGDLVIFSTSDNRSG